ncbi:MAG: DUF349 domain-containing protein [Pseudomonadota bacterium]
MFEFIFKRPDGQTDAPAAPQGAPASDAASAQRQAQMDKLRAVQSEHEAAAFILQCEFSELRLAAAEVIHAQAELETVHAAMRNTDRRVAKLMQSRLDAIRHHGAELERGHACILQAQHILAEVHLTPNHVADIDRAWSVIAAPELGEQFDAVRAALAARLEAQIVLQRAVIDSLATLRQLGSAALPAHELASQLEQMAAAHALALAAPEHASLPRQLVREFAAEHARLSASLGALGQRQDALAARTAQLAQWSAAAPASLQSEQIKRRWNELPALPEGEDAALLQQQFEELLASVPAPERKPKAERAAPVPPDPAFMAALDAMEAALAQGSLQSAVDSDKILNDSKATRLTSAITERLANARAELKRLSAWARWGGNVSREELVKAVEQLPSQKVAMGELAKKVGSMRERWKALDALSGPAPRSLWERFDGACTTAYAPAAAHFKQLADERHTNAAKARALIEQANGAAPAESDAPGWKQVAAQVQRLRLAWTQLGAIDRKDKKKLDRDFAAALGKLQGPLAQQRELEVARREQLINAVAALEAGDRHTLDALRRLQERWQEQAKALPLERKAEQALWLRFRAACDAVFAKRKESAHAADAERHANQQSKEAICARLEAAASAADNAASGKLLRECGSEWRAIGAVPRANEAKLEKRYHGAINALERQIDEVRRNADAAKATAMRDKLRLCQAFESALADASGAAPAEDWSARWAALPPLANDYERALNARFQGALAALAGDGAAYVRTLEQNRDTLLREILRMEIVAGIDSGSEFARERLKLQVEVLQSSLKSGPGQKALAPAAAMLALCAMPALADARTATRIEHLFRRVGKDSAREAEKHASHHGDSRGGERDGRGARGGEHNGRREGAREPGREGSRNAGRDASRESNREPGREGARNGAARAPGRDGEAGRTPAARPPRRDGTGEASRNAPARVPGRDGQAVRTAPVHAPAGDGTGDAVRDSGREGSAAPVVDTPGAVE